VSLYTRHQLLVLLALVAAFGGGLAVDRWRREHPEAVANLERFDREPAPATPAPGEGAGEVGARGHAPIDVNRATADELTRLPGVGPALALRIIEAREARPFASVDDLQRVRGMGAAKLERLRPLVTVSPP
jgi:competence ComEA-like helix-hairpin-helix protein